MTETATAVNETAETAEPAFDISSLDEFGQQYVSRLTADIERLNGLRKDRKSKSSDPREIADSVYDTLKSGEIPEGFEGISEKVMEQYNKAEEIVAKAVAHFREVANKYGQEKAATADNAEEVAALDTEIDTLNKKVSKAVQYLALEYPGAENALPDVVRVGKSGGTGKGSGGRKLRGFTVTVDSNVATLPSDDGPKSSFAAGAKVLGIPTADLQRAYMVAAGTEDADAFPASLELTVTGKDEKDHAVKIERNA